MSESKKPVIQARDRNFSASVFSREVDFKGDGKMQTVYSICVQRSYKPKDSTEWKRENINLNIDDCLRLAELCRNTYHQTLAYAARNKPATQAADYPSQPVDADGFDTDSPF